jgi:hypothetical protein
MNFVSVSGRVKGLSALRLYATEFLLNYIFTTHIPKASDCDIIGHDKRSAVMSDE